jgi:hypothetical protein
MMNVLWVEAERFYLQSASNTTKLCGFQVNLMTHSEAKHENLRMNIITSQYLCLAFGRNYLFSRVSLDINLSFLVWMTTLVCI